MLELISGYLLIIIALFSANLGLFFGNFKNNVFLRCFIVVLLLFMILFISGFINIGLANYFSYVFILIAIVNFIIFIYYLNNSASHLYSSICAVSILFYTVVLFLSSQIESFYYLNSLLYSLVSFVVIFASYQLSKLLIYAKRDYPIIIGEYMSLSSILIFIFALTFSSTRNLDYSMFSSFLILTPTYQLVYILIAFIVVLIIGFYINDKNSRL